MKLGLALGGGGGRGAALIGVLTELNRLGVQPHLITGTSVGGMIGVLYAAGVDIAGMEAFFRQMHVDNLFAWPKDSWSLVSNKKIEALLEKTIGRPDFSDLKIPLAVTATDLVNHRLVVLDEGDVVTAVLATIALPIILPPVEKDGFVLVDGGLLDNVPFDVAYARGASHVIAIDITNASSYEENAKPSTPPSGRLDKLLKYTQRYGAYQVMTGVIDLITEQSLKTRLALSEPDILIRPEIGTIGLLDFNRMDEGILAGKTAVIQREKEIINLLNQTKV
jgi:NTE family protein